MKGSVFFGVLVALAVKLCIPSPPQNPEGTSTISNGGSWKQNFMSSYSANLEALGKITKTSYWKSNSSVRSVLNLPSACEKYVRNFLSPRTYSKSKNFSSGAYARSLLHEKRRSRRARLARR